MHAHSLVVLEVTEGELIALQALRETGNTINLNNQEAAQITHGLVAISY
jgi:hypothetical protein